MSNKNGQLQSLDKERSNKTRQPSQADHTNPQKRIYPSVQMNQSHPHNNQMNRSSQMSQLGQQNNPNLMNRYSQTSHLNRQNQSNHPPRPSQPYRYNHLNQMNHPRIAMPYPAHQMPPHYNQMHHPNQHNLLSIPRSQYNHRAPGNHINPTNPLNSITRIHPGNYGMYRAGQSNEENGSNSIDRPSCFWLDESEKQRHFEEVYNLGKKLGRLLLVKKMIQYQKCDIIILHSTSLLIYIYNH